MLILIYLSIIAGIILLQIFLSKKEGKWPGLILPLIFFLCSYVIPLNVAEGPSGEAFALFFFALGLGNIPTAVLLAIYFGCRWKGRKKQMDKMKIQDL